MKFKCNGCDFVRDTNAKLKKHMKCDHTENIPQMDGNHTVDEEVLESVEYSTEDSVEKEIAFEIFYDKKKCSQLKKKKKEDDYCAKTYPNLITCTMYI